LTFVLIWNEQVNGTFFYGLSSMKTDHGSNKIISQQEDTMNKKMHFVMYLPIIAGLLLAACSTGTSTPELSDSNWKLAAYGPASNPIPAAEGIETSVKFGADGQISGNMGCNGFSGEYKQAGSQLSFGAMMSTMMACPEPQMSQESISLSILSGTVDFRMEGDKLTIDGAGGNQLILVRQ
jgi:heat shock protein HslJ